MTTPPPGIRVRHLGAEDWRVARAARLGALATSPPGSFSTTFEEAADWDERRWRHWQASRSLFVLESDPGPVGCAGVLRESSGPVLVSVWVHPTVRGTGASRLLIGTIVDHVRAAGDTTLRLWVVEGNTAAEKLYHAMDFEPTGRRQLTAAHSPHYEYEMIRHLA
ncbi:N-acetyltransferase family protein [Nocardia sp. NPDC003482]